MKKNILLVSVVLLGMFVLFLSGCEKSESPQSEKAKQIEALVNKAAALIESKGKEAFDEFRLQGSEWFYGETYIFVDDMQGTVRVNPPSPEIEGKNLIDFKDASGKLLTREMIAMLEVKESGWIDYVWPKPGEAEPSKKWSYIRRVEIDEESYIVGAGFYAE